MAASGVDSRAPWRWSRTAASLDLDATNESAPADAGCQRERETAHPSGASAPSAHYRSGPLFSNIGILPSTQPSDWDDAGDDVSWDAESSDSWNSGDAHRSEAAGATGLMAEAKDDGYPHRKVLALPPIRQRHDSYVKWGEVSSPVWSDEKGSDESGHSDDEDPWRAQSRSLRRLINQTYSLLKEPGLHPNGVFFRAGTAKWRPELRRSG